MKIRVSSTWPMLILPAALVAILPACSPEGQIVFPVDDVEALEGDLAADTAGWAEDADEGSEAPAGTGERRRRVRSPFSGYSLYVEPGSHAAAQAEEWRDTAPDDAALMDVLAAEPLAYWIGDWTNNVTDTVDDLLDDAGSQLRTLVVYNIPYRDCGAWSAGGAADVLSYGTFIAEIAAGIEGRRVIVVLEPDALALQTCLSDAQSVERLALISAAVETLTLAGASVYIDAGDSNWIGATEMAGYLLDAGVAGAAGFALNVSHTEYTADEMAFANELRSILGTSAHYVVDTGRAGLGPTDDNQWCNPLGRAIGERPTLEGGAPGLDALLWIKPPGESDGECNGGPAAGDWWAEYALELAELGATG